MPSALQKNLSSLAAGNELLTTAQLLEAGISDQSITRLVEKGTLVRVRRGIYEHADSPTSEHHDLIQVAKSASRAVVVLVSALRFHEIGTQSPHEVWIQLPAQTRVPKIDWPPIRVIRTRVNELQTAGVEHHQLGGAEVAITTPARTVADCFKHRNKLGIDVCVEALRETLNARKAKIGEISEMGRLLRVGKIMRPYLEAMI
ncbi:type IV toxin-antitoxin system AbiEi family antitoxin domain-containing protein [Synoicihabitans lomoniglobus]|uniref:Type IV toxin-antitoxin system AbiEi family antitoxin domain-containing protein n=1 Tax=Synoicihabitans lomoniglobus TaxID=2909285 RepID=A0AAF0A1K6_9BACT|nr:type IV toxin-antitoxin system AbiEi family antitoxin domain-containing protein [Opitutaceae bacterium LMO-M01]WED65107.1 type IV toxin-antitoxin system AbiEi family antitoxin domain-containing protein [Opitutaceae bacterium LMO-M01]